MPGDAMINPNTLAVLGVSEPFLGGRGDKCLDSLSSLAGDLGIPFLDLGSLFGDGPFLIGDTLSVGVSGLQKRSLILGGGALEGAVVQTALTTLLDGYDLFVPADLFAALEPERSALVFDRIRDVGGIITSERQILLECLAQTDAPEARAPLQARFDQLLLQTDGKM
ncbi:MAG: isochorismatase family protein [Pseudomonadota bacterium]